jgi:hypothetical protein
MKKYFLILISSLLILMLNTCSHNAENQCDVLLQKAKGSLYQFYISNDTLSLFKAKNYLDSIDCASFKYKVFDTKISLFILLKEYSEGIEYVKTLNNSDFKREYQKNMYIKSFEAMICEVQGDTLGQNKLYQEIVSEIQSYLDKTSNQETLIDFFTIKSKIETKAEILKEIELLKATGKYDIEFLNILIELQEGNREKNYTLIK